MSAPRRVLLVAPQLPWPPHQGTTIRNLHVARELGRTCELGLLCFAPLDADPGPLREACARIDILPPPPPRSLARRLADLPTTAVPDLARRLDDPAMRAAAARIGADGPWDVVQIEGMEMARHGYAALAAARAAQAASRARLPRLVYDAHNAEWVLQDRAWRTDLRRPRTWPGALYSALQTAKIRRFERDLLARADATVAVSEADAAALRALAPDARIEVVPNGVDTEGYAVAPPGGEVDATCVFTGKMDFRPNIDAMTWFCREVWPRVRASRRDARLRIVGRDPAPRVAALHDPGAGVEVTGAVPDVRPYLAEAAVVAVPLRVGGGTRLKVLEAMAMAKAIAATSLAVEGLDLESGREALLADAPEDLAAAILRLFDAPEERAALGRRARLRVERDYRWSVLVPRIAALHGEPRA